MGDDDQIDSKIIDEHFEKRKVEKTGNGQTSIQSTERNRSNGGHKLERNPMTTVTVIGTGDAGITNTKQKRRSSKSLTNLVSSHGIMKKTAIDSGWTNNNFYDPSKKTRDPFALVDFQKFPDDTLPPFVVKIKLDALALMDLHAHCFHTEVIGCLGGFYCKVTRTLHVLAAEPCYSIEDHETECEMDPVSQALALDKLEQKHFQMVGWYHSHPTFLPKPSVRDIDTQSYYQQVFKNRSGKESSQGNGTARRRVNDNFGSNDELDSHPFVAFIISPFLASSLNNNQLTSKSFTRYQAVVDRPADAKFYANNMIYSYHHPYNQSYCYFTPELNTALASSIKCFWVADSKSQTPSKQRNLLIPYEIDVNLIRDENFIPSISNGLSEMCQWLLQNYSNSKSMVDLFRRYIRIGSINVTYLEKMIASLSYHLQNPSVLHLCTEFECERVRMECVSILMKELIENRNTRTERSDR